MADSIQINNYIKTLGLTGQDAKDKLAELSALSNDELTQLISGSTKTNAKGTSIETNDQHKEKNITLKSGRRIQIKDGKTKYFAADGVELKESYFQQKEGIIDIKNSGRYSVTKGNETKYYAADGTELKESYFKQVESSDVQVKTSDGKTHNLNKVLETRISSVTTNLKEAEEDNGFIGKAWSGFKNLTGIGDSSDKVREQQEQEVKLLAQFNTNEQTREKTFKELTGEEYTQENLEKFIKGEIKLKSEVALTGYKEGQEMATDVAADMVSGIAAVGIYAAAVAAAPVTGGASIAIGLAAATASGAAIKTGLKAADAASAGREYSLKDAGHDAATGAFSGVLAPVTGGLGGAVGKTVATKMGIQAVKQVGKEVAADTVEAGVKQGIKTALTNPTGYEYVGGNLVKRGVAMSAEMATDGAVGGAVDNAFRTAYDGGSLEDVANSAVEGFVGGAIMSPLIGGGMKAVGKAGHELGSKLHNDTPNTKVPDTVAENTGSEPSGITDKLATTRSREDFAAIEDELKSYRDEQKTRIKNSYKNSGSLKNRKNLFSGVKSFNEENKLLKLFDDPEFCQLHKDISDILSKKFSANDIDHIFTSRETNDILAIKTMWNYLKTKHSDLLEKDINKANILRFLEGTKHENVDYQMKAIDLMKDKIGIFYVSCIETEQNYNFLAKAIEDDMPEQTLQMVLHYNDLMNLYLKLRDLDCIPKEDLSDIISKAPKLKEQNKIDDYLNLAKKIYNNDNCEHKLKAKMLNAVYNFSLYDKKNIDDLMTLINDKDFPDSVIINLIDKVQKIFIINSSKESINDVRSVLELCKSYKDIGITPNQLLAHYSNLSKLPVEDLQKQCKMLGKDTISNMSVTDVAITCYLQKLKDVKDINELSLEEQKLILNKLISGLDDMFKISDKMHEQFRLIPRNTDDYCSLVKSLAQSIGIEYNPLSSIQKTLLPNSLDNLTSLLKKFSNAEISNLKLSQEYSREAFINDVLQKTQGLSKQEQNTVLSYFGFKLTPNKNNPTGYTISRYPVNVERKKLEIEIPDPKLRQIAETLKENVSHFSTKNQIKCDNPEIQSLLNQIADVLPEIHTMVGRKNIEGNDILISSLSTLNSISKDPNYLSLSQNDKKILQLSSLLHNISEFEGFKDITHTHESSFDAYHITDKLDLPKEDRLKLYNIIKNHEWIDYIKQAKSKKDITERFQSLAYDLKDSNTLDMVLMLSRAELKGDDLKLFDKYSNVLRKNITKLKTNQPVLPATKVPEASEIKKAIKYVNADGSVIGHDGKIIKGVYQNKDGLVIIKYNEVENWEQLGFPKGTKSRGVDISNIEKSEYYSPDGNIDMDTGNIKFFVHAFNSDVALAKFKKFLEPDSDVVLSVSYAQRPESQYNFFTDEGILLDIPTQNIHAGGFTDIGSGWRKTINKIKEDFIFDGYRVEDRDRIPKAIKQATGMSDREYISFVEQFSDRPISDIQPKELQDKIVYALSTMGGYSTTYNEILCSNPTAITGAFMTIVDKYDNLVDCVDSKTRSEYLKKYALENDLPLFIFGQ